MKSIYFKILFVCLLVFGGRVSQGQITTTPIQASSLNVINVTQMAKVYFTQDISLGNYSGVDFTDAGLIHLLEEAQKVKDSLDYDVFTVEFPYVSTGANTGLEDNYQLALNDIQSDKYLLFCFVLSTENTEEVAEFYTAIYDASIEGARDGESAEINFLEGFINAAVTSQFNETSILGNAQEAEAYGLSKLLEIGNAYILQEDILSAILFGIGPKGKAYCKHCTTIDDTNNNNPRFALGDKMFKCLFGKELPNGDLEEVSLSEIIDANGNVITSDESILNGTNESIPEDATEIGLHVFSYTINGVQHSIRVFCTPLSQEYPSDFCDNADVTFSEISFSLEIDLINCESNSLSQSFTENGISQTSTPNQLDSYLGELPEFLSQNDYDGVFYVFKNNVLHKYDRNGHTEFSTPQSIFPELLAYQEGNQYDQAYFMNFDPVTGELKMDFKFREGFLAPNAIPDSHPYLGGLNINVNSEEIYTAKIREIIFSLTSTDNLENFSTPALHAVSLPAPPEYYDGELKVKESSIYKTLFFLGGQVNHIVKNFELDPRLWNPADEHYSPSIVHSYVPVAGIADQSMTELKDLKDLVVMAGEVCKDPVGTIQPIYEFASNLTVEQAGNLIEQTVSDQYTSWQDPTEFGTYTRVRITVSTIYIIVKIVSEGPELIVKFLRKSADAQDFMRKFTNSDVVEKLSDFDPEINSQFLDDFKDLDVHADFDANPGMVDGWNIINDLPPNIRTKVLNLEVGSKLDNIGLHPNLSESHKRIKKIVKNLDGAGDKGIHISNRIKSGELDDISGFDKVLNKSTDAGYLNAAKQTIDKADETILNGVQKNRLVFEDEVSGIYDVDFGVKSVSGSPIYEKAYQLKSAGTPNAVKNNLGSNKVSQIMDSPSTSKIYEVEMRSGSFTELESIGDFWTKLNQTKSVYPDLQIQVKDINGLIKIY